MSKNGFTFDFEKLSDYKKFYSKNDEHNNHNKSDNFGDDPSLQYQNMAIKITKQIDYLLNPNIDKKYIGIKNIWSLYIECQPRGEDNSDNFRGLIYGNTIKNLK